MAGGQDLVAERTTAKTAAADTVDALLDQFLERYVRKQGLRSAGEIERALKVYVRPRIGSVPVLELGRRAIVEMLDAVEDNHGPVQADRVLAYVRKALNWHATRDDHFRSPIVRGMSRTRPLERARTRVLDDQETFRDVKP